MTVEQLPETTSEAEIGSELKVWRVRFLNALLITASIVAIVPLVNSIVQAVQSPEWWPQTVPFVVGYLFVLALTVFQGVDYRLRAWGFLVVGYAIGIMYMALLGLLGNGMIFLLVMPMLGLILIGLRSGLAMTGFSLLVYAFFAAAAQQGWLQDRLIIQDNSVELSQWLSQGLSFALILIILVVMQGLFSRAQTQALLRARRTADELAQARDLLQTRSEALDRYARLLEAAARISRDITALLDRKLLVQRTVDLIAERLGFEHVAVYLLGPAGEGIALAAAAGAEGTADSDKPDDDPEIPTVVVRVIQMGSSFASPSTEEVITFELALPLTVAGQAVGALLVQTSETAPLGDEDISALRLMADQLAVAMENARLFAEAQTSLRELNALYRHYTAEAWQQFLGEQSEALQHRLGPEEISDKVWQTLFEEAKQTGAAVTGMSEGVARQHLLVLPVKLRYVPVGVLGFHRPVSAGPWQAGEIVAIETVADRLALAIDNMRLLDTAQRRAARERQIGEISARMRSTLDIESVLKTTVDEMYQVLGLEDVLVRLVSGELES